MTIETHRPPLRSPPDRSAVVTPIIFSNARTSSPDGGSRDGDIEKFIEGVKERYYKGVLGMERGDVPADAICVSNGSVGAGKIKF